MQVATTTGNNTMNNTPETDELDRSLKNKYTPVLDCYYKMKIHSCRLEIDRDEQCRLLGMSAERECDLRGKLERERALADRLAEALDYYYSEDSRHHIASNRAYARAAWSALAAWKEARSE